VDESYETWIANLMNGRQSDAEQAARAKFRAAQAAKPAAPVTTRPAGVAATGPNTWVVSDRSDGLAQYTLLDGPGRFANCIGQ
jgi:sarcosine oxidase gamma subunit